MSRAGLLAVGLALIAGSAGAEPLWVELAPAFSRPPMEIAGATWFEPPPAAWIEIEVRSEDAPLVWRVDLDAEGMADARVEQALFEVGPGRFRAWVPPSLATPWAVVPAASGAVRVFTAREADGDRALQRWERRTWRWAGRPGDPIPPPPDLPGVASLASVLSQVRDAPAGANGPAGMSTTARLRAVLLLGRLELVAPGTPRTPRAGSPYGGREFRLPPGGCAELDLQGPGVLVLDTVLVRQGGPPPSLLPYDLWLDAGHGKVAARRAGAAALHAPADGAGIAESHPRRIRATVPPGTAPWSACVVGPDARLRARMYRVRPRFGVAPDAVRLARLGTTTEDALETLGVHGGGAFGVALDPAAPLPTLERALIAGALTDAPRGPEQARATVRAAWFEASAYGGHGVVAPRDAIPIALALEYGEDAAAPGPDGRHRRGIYSLLRPGVEVPLAAPPHPTSVELWSVVRVLGLNAGDQPAVATVEVDGGEPIRLLLQGAVTTARLAVRPGPHTWRVAVPEGASELVFVGVDLRSEQIVPGPWPEGDYPFARLTHIAAADDHGATFFLPQLEGPGHVQIQAWWSDPGPREVLLDTDGGTRRAWLYPGSPPPPALMEVPGDGAVPIHGAAAALDAVHTLDWVRVRVPPGDPPLWVRVRVRQAIERPPAGSAPPVPESAPELRSAEAGGLEDLSRVMPLVPRGGAEEDGLRLARAEMLIDMGLPGYARRDLEVVRGRAEEELLARVESLDELARSVAGRDHVLVHEPPAGGVLVLDLPACAGTGPAVWLADLPPEDPAVRLSAGALEDLGVPPRAVPVERALAQRAMAAAVDDPGAALSALVHATGARARAEDAAAAAVVVRAMDATRPDVMSTAEVGPDRVELSVPAITPDPVAEPREWARQVIVGAPLSRVDRVLGAGTTWIVDPGPEGPLELEIEAFCEDLRIPRERDGDTCSLEVRVGSGAADLWSLPRGEVRRRTVRRVSGERVAIALAPGGHARYVGLALRAGDWQVPQRRAWYHVASAGAPVRYRLAGPTRLTLELAVRTAAGSGAEGATIRLGGQEPLDLAWDTPIPGARSDQEVPYAVPLRVDLNLREPGMHELIIETAASPLAIRVTRRVAAERMLAQAPEAAAPVVPTGVVTALVFPPGHDAPRLPRAHPAGTLHGRVQWASRWTVDEEPTTARQSSLEFRAGHQVRLGRHAGWLSSAALIRIFGPAPPSAGLDLRTHHRLPVVDLRLGGRIQALIQDAGGQTLAAGALWGRLDRPIRLASGWTLVPALTTRAYLQPAEGRVPAAYGIDQELTSAYRRDHPFGLGAQLDLLWRPWVDGVVVVGARARSNPDIATIDHAGVRAELRLYPRPVGVVLRGDVSRRFRDAARAEPYWRGEITAGAWADLGPPALWLRPEVKVCYLPGTQRVEATAGIAVVPGRRGLVHTAPNGLLFEELREPMLVDGRWVR